MVTAVTIFSNIAVIINIFHRGQQNNIFCRLVLFPSLSDSSLATATQILATTMLSSLDVPAFSK